MVADPVRWALEYLVTTHEDTVIKKRRSELRDNLSGYIKDNGEEDENGNILWYFDQPVGGEDDTWYSGLMLQRRTSEFVNEDRAKEIITSNNLEERCIRRVTVDYVDYDELYACNQQGLVTDEEIDSMLEFNETYALVKMKS